MTSTRHQLQDFVLTPQQQNLLFAALNSNRATNSPSANALTMSPSSIHQSPVQESSVNGLEESPFLDYDYSFDGNDSGFDFSFDDGSQPKMIGDLPSASDDGKADSASPENDSSDKRSHPDDDDDEESGAKRRESSEKVPKKPGRKPLTSEPSSKRKAQNRAAQRAFRERKERHLKDLETKVSELEKASEAANHENDLLRAQVEKMSVELSEYKKRVSLIAHSRPPVSQLSQQKFGAPIFNNINDVDFQFEFPKFGQLPGPPSTNGVSSAPRTSSLETRTPPYENGASGASGASGAKTNGTSSHVSPSDKSKSNSASPTSSSYTGALDAQTKEDLARFSGIFSPPLTNNNVASAGASRSSMDSHFSAGGTTTSSPSASSNSNMGASSSCGTSPEPLTQSPVGFKPVDTLTTIGEEQPTLTSAGQDFGHFANIDINDIGLFATQGNFQFDPQLFGGYREPQESILATGGIDDSFFNDAFDVDFTTPYNVAPSPVTRKKDLISRIDAAKDADTEPVTSPNALLTCNKIWEKLQNCPKVKNGDFDLDGLCSDLQKKAKCSGSGAVVDEKDFTSVMKKYLGKGENDPMDCPDALLANSEQRQLTA